MKHKARKLSIKEIEKNRSNAYDYINFDQCDDVCMFYCTKGGTQPPDCLTNH